MQLTRLRVLLMLVLAVTSTGFLTWHFASAIPSGGHNKTVEPSISDNCRVTVTKSGSQAEDWDGITGQNHQVTGTDDAVIQDAINNVLDSGRTNKETVCLLGSFTLTTNMLRIPSYTVIDARQAFITEATNFQCASSTCEQSAMLENADSDAGKGNYPTPTHDIDIIGGIWDGNAANQATEANRAVLSFRNTWNILVLNPTIQHFKGLAGVLFADVVGQTNFAQIHNQLIGGIIQDVFGSSQPESGSGVLMTCNDCHISATEVFNTKRGFEIEDHSTRNVVDGTYCHDLRVSDGSQCILATQVNSTQLTNNRILKSAGVGIQFTLANYSFAIGNIIQAAGQGATNPGLVLNSSHNDTITGNTFVLNTLDGLDETGSQTDFNVVVANTFANNHGGNAQFSIIGFHTLFVDNVGANPVGKITNFIVGSFIGICGTGTTVVSTTVYTVCGTDLGSWGCTGGTVTAIALQDNLGNQIFSVANCASLPTINPAPKGYKIVFTFSVAPTFTIYGN